MIRLLTLLVLIPSFAQAYFTTLDTGEVIKAGSIRAGGGAQFVLNQYDGANFLGNVDVPINDSQSVRGVFGFGKIDFQVAGYYKWVPFPDLKKQPAVGGMAGVTWAKIGSISEYSLRLHPLVSKKFATEVGDITPYASLPFGFTTRNGAPAGADSTFVPFQLVGGAEFHFLDLQRWKFYSELGLNLNKAFSYIALSASYQFAYGK